MSPAFAFKPPRTKAARYQQRARNDSLHTTTGLFWIRHYRRVKHHQLRRRLLKKRK